MKRTTRAQLEQLLTVARNVAGCKTLTLDHAPYGWRVDISDTGRELSPRLTARELKWWLNAFIDGLQWSNRGGDVL